MSADGHAAGLEPRAAQAAPSTRAPALALLLTGLTGALLVGISQFLALFHTHIASTHRAIASASVGSEQGYALLPVAIVAIVLAVVIYLSGSRAALLAIGLLGALTLVIALSRDLPIARSRGSELVAGRIVEAANTAAVGVVVEAVGGVLLLSTCLGGLLLLRPAPQRPRGRPTGLGARRSRARSVR
jgi:hypothetical protein